MKSISIISVTFILLVSCGYSKLSRDFEKYEKVVREEGTIDENGLKQGTWIKYNSLDKPITKGTYLNDTLSGIAEAYHRDGSIYTRCKYFKGELIDTFLIYYDNGQLNSYSWRDSTGASQGEFRIYHENGELRQIGNHKDGRLFGTIKVYFDDGSIESIENYNQYGFNGESVHFKENGDTLRKILYKNDTVIKRIDY